jgi:hypothetical protein
VSCGAAVGIREGVGLLALLLEDTLAVGDHLLRYRGIDGLEHTASLSEDLPELRLGEVRVEARQDLGDSLGHQARRIEPRELVVREGVVRLDAEGLAPGVRARDCLARLEVTTGLLDGDRRPAQARSPYGRTSTVPEGGGGP